MSADDETRGTVRLWVPERRSLQCLRWVRLPVTAALVTLAVLVAGIATALVVVVRWGMNAKDESSRAMDRLHNERVLNDEHVHTLTTERNELQAKCAVLTSQLAASKVRLVTAEIQRNTAMREGVAHAVQTIRSSNAVDAAAAVNAILSSVLPGMP